MCLVTIDGTDFKVRDPYPRRSAWFAPKFGKAAGLWYEMAVCIATGDIVHIVGPFAPKGSPDITIFRWKLRAMLGVGEKAMGDKGYVDSKACTPYNANNKHHRRAMSLARCRHETINRMLKQWAILRDGFRHELHKHHIVFRAVAAITQLKFENGYMPMQVGMDVTYDDPVVKPDFYFSTVVG